MKLAKEDILKLLDISGSIASVTAMALVISEKTISSVSMGTIVGYIASSSLSIAMLTLIILGLKSIDEEITNIKFKIIFWLAVTPIAASIFIMIVRFIFAFGILFFNGIISEPI